jgi:hypothetical protein
MKPAAIEAMGWSDVELQGLAWEEAGRDLVLRIDVAWAPEGERNRVVTCQWAEAVSVKLEFPPGRGGRPLSWSATWTELPDGRCSVVLDFAADGEIRLVCAEVEVTVSS